LLSEVCDLKGFTVPTEQRSIIVFPWQTRTVPDVLPGIAWGGVGTPACQYTSNPAFAQDDRRTARLAGL